MKGHSNISIGKTASGHGVNPPNSESHTQSGKAAIVPAEQAINLHLAEVVTLRSLATTLLDQYNALIDLPEAELLAWQKEARRRRSLPENTNIQ